MPGSKANDSMIVHPFSTGFERKSAARSIRTLPVLTTMREPWPLQIVAAVIVCYRHKRGEKEESQYMALGSVQKSTVIGKYRVHAKDCGSPEVQVALLSERIAQLTEHFKLHAKDHASRRGLLMMVNRRRRLLDYLKDRHADRYRQVIQSLGIRR